MAAVENGWHTPWGLWLHKATVGCGFLCWCPASIVLHRSGRWTVGDVTTGVNEHILLNGSNWAWLLVWAWPAEECESFRSIFECGTLTLNTNRSAASMMLSRVRFTDSPLCRKEWKPKDSAAKSILLSSGNWKCAVLIRWQSWSNGQWALKMAVKCVRYLAGGSYPAIAETVLLRSWLERH